MQRSACLAGTLIAAATLACSDGPGGPDETGTVVFQLATAGTGATTAPSLAVSVTRGPDVIVITDVQLVARKIKLGQDDGSCPADPEDDSEDGEECPPLRLGPLLLDPPVDEGADPTFTVELPAGTYDELMLQIHKPTSNTEDAAFLGANPEFNGISIRVNGTFNGTPFSFTTDLTEVVRIALSEPVEVVEDGEVGLTLLLDAGSWFLDQGGTALLDPAALTQQDRSRIEQNIRQSFHAFEDDDADGEDE